MLRRDALRAGLAAAGAGVGLGLEQRSVSSQPTARPPAPKASPAKSAGFWPDGIRMPVSLSLMFESGAQQRFLPSTPFANFAPADGIYDLPTISWYRYGVTEGIPRALDMLERLKIVMTSHMSGEAVEMYPDIARSIVQAGHEAAAHGWNWTTQSTMDNAEEKEFIRRNIDIVKAVTGQRVLGYNAPGLRGSPNVLSNLHDLGFVYTIDDVSRDEPFMIKLDAKREIAAVPYTVYLNDIRAYEARYFSNSDFLDNMKRSFDRLYAESATRRRMFVVTMHDRLVRPEHAETMEQFLRYAMAKSGVAFMKKIDIANYIRKAPDAIREPVGVVYPTIPGLYRG